MVSRLVLNSVHDCGLQAFPLVWQQGQLVSTKARGQSRFAHGATSGGLDGSGFVPAGDVRAHCFGGGRTARTPLDEYSFNRIRIVAAPEFGEIFESLIVAGRHRRSKSIIGTSG